MPHHEVSLPIASECSTVPSLLRVPPLPHFLGRQLEMYRVMQALFVKKRRSVHITGPDGIGKVSLAKAIAHYMEQRNMWGDNSSMYWLPSIHSGEDGDTLSWWSRLMELIQNPSLLPEALLSDADYKNVRPELCKRLHDEKVVVIYNALAFPEEQQRLKLGLWLDDLIEHTSWCVKVIVIHRLEGKVVSQHDAGYAGGEQELLLEPLNFESTLKLFGCFCPRVTAHSWKPAAILQKRPTTTLRVLGEGIPAKTIMAAKNMTESKYKELVSFLPVPPTSDNCIAADIASTGDNAGDDNGNDEEENAFSPPLRSQIDLQKQFAQPLKREGKIHRKVVTSFIRKAVKGERIVTTIDGIQESLNTVKDDDSWVVCGKAAGEYYVLTMQQFQECYEESRVQAIQSNSSSPSRLQKGGFAEYPFKRQVRARKVTEGDMTYFRHGNTTAREAYFMAPWGESMRVEQGDYLVMQYYPDGNDEIYRVECDVFEFSYAFDEEDKPIGSWIP